MAALHVLEDRGVLEIEIDLARVQHLHSADIVPGGGEQAQAAFQLVERREEIGHEHDHAALADERGEFLQRLAEIRGVAGRLGLEPAKDRFQLVPPVARRDELAHVAVECRQANGVALLREEPRQRRGECAGVIAFLDAGIVAAELHRLGKINQEHAAQVGFVLEFLDELAVGPRHHFPVEKPDVIAG